MNTSSLDQFRSDSTTAYLTPEELIESLLSFSPNTIARTIIDVEPDLYYRRELVRLIADPDIQYEVANTVFGEHLAGSLGARSTENHPKTDFGIPCIKDDVYEK